MNKYIDSVNMKFGMRRQPWCAMTGSDMLREGNASYPVVWSALALAFAKAKLKYTLKQVANNEYIPKPGDIIVYDYGSGRGHIDFVVSFENDSWVTIGGNRGNEIALWKGSTNKLIMSKAKWIIDVSGDYSYDYIEEYSHIKLLATYYSDYFHGRKTSSGEIFNQYDLTAASNEFKLGDTVEVTNLRNNLKVKVKINDRMKSKGRIDLSKAAALSIKLKRDSVLVKYRKAS